MAIPQYCQDDPALARVVNEAAADVFLDGLNGVTVEQCLPRERRELAVVSPDATVLEIAALMARSRTPLVAVARPKDGELVGVITLDALLDRMFAG